MNTETIVFYETRLRLAPCKYSYLKKTCSYIFINVLFTGKLYNELFTTEYFKRLFTSPVLFTEDAIYFAELLILSIHWRKYDNGHSQHSGFFPC